MVEAFRLSVSPSFLTVITTWASMLAGNVVATGGGRQVPFVVPTHRASTVQASPEVHGLPSSHAVPTGAGR